ncbi:hypothetical protein F2Q69_00032720 [Brassica cretica]|uniref:Uncharacterized protein n=1 Tax=Brassica cretica TaxID=69181 RepID=A0A8S9SAD6_BRACR|nr:hypothetical protein F2Q69_00032720 [Brassica cretica]
MDQDLPVWFTESVFGSNRLSSFTWIKMLVALLGVQRRYLIIPLLIPSAALLTDCVVTYRRRKSKDTLHMSVKALTPALTAASHSSHDLRFNASLIPSIE